MAAALETAPVGAAVSTPSGRHAWWRRPAVAIGGSVILLWFLIALTVPLWSPYDVYAPSGERLAAPSADHLLGTDSLGRDVLTRTLWGARQSIPMAVLVIVAAVVIGGALGTIAGYVGGFVDSCIMRFADVTSAFPPILLAMSVAAALGPGLLNAAIAIIVVWWPVYARITRVQVMSVKRREHIESAVAIGATPGRIVRRHVLPLSYTPALVNATMDFGQVVILTASLSFLGLGAVPPSPEWGAMITEGARNFYQWWIAAGPGLAIVSLVLAANYVGDGLRDHFDPKAAS